MKYNRVLLKLSGESLMGKQAYGIAPEMLEQYALDIKAAVEAGVEVAIVIGGGNISVVSVVLPRVWTVFRATTWECLQPSSTAWHFRQNWRNRVCVPSYSAVSLLSLSARR